MAQPLNPAASTGLCAVTVRKKTKEKERCTGCQNRRFLKCVKTHRIFTLPDQKWPNTLRLGGGGGQFGGMAWTLYRALRRALKIYKKCVSIFNLVLNPKRGPRTSPGAVFDPSKPLLEAPHSQTWLLGRKIHHCHSKLYVYA